MSNHWYGLSIKHEIVATASDYVNLAMLYLHYDDASVNLACITSVLVGTLFSVEV